MNWQTIGNEKATGALRRALDGSRLPHALLIAGPEHVGKMSLALDLASALNCTGDEKPCGECAGCSRTRRGLHTDIHVVGLQMAAGGARSRTLIGVDQVREVQREVALAPFEGGCRVVIFDGAELLSEEAANSLLKTLEEPPPGVYLLLLTPKPEALLPTVVSRCQTVDLKPVPSDIIAAHLVERLGMDADDADRAARLSGGRPGWAIRAAEDPELLEAVEEKVATVEELVLGSMETRFEHAAKLGSATDRDRESGRRGARGVAGLVAGRDADKGGRTATGGQPVEDGIAQGGGGNAHPPSDYRRHPGDSQDAPADRPQRQLSPGAGSDDAGSSPCEATMTEGHRVSRVVGVRLNEMQPLRFFRPGEQDLEVGDLVLVDTEDGPRRGRVVIAPGQVAFSALTGPVDTILGRLDE